jgi:DNA-binding transcriptional MocR family regulator
VAKEDTATSQHVTVPKSVTEPDVERKIDLTTSLQYGMAQGYPPLLSFVRQFTREHLHPTVPYRGGPDVSLTCGSTDGFAKTLEVLVDPWIEGVHDPRQRPGLLCETFVYGGILNQLPPKGVQIQPVAADEGGMVASALELVLAYWDPARGKRPNLLYTVS